MAEVSSKALKQTDSGFFGEEHPIFDKSYLKQHEPGATRLTRCLSKLIAYGGDEKSGCHGNFLEYVHPFLQEHRFRSLPLEPFHGNRFNILLKNAGVSFFLAEQVIGFLESNQENRLQKAVLKDLKTPEYLAG
jgi:hypothetical protein